MRRWAIFMSAMCCCVLLAASTAVASTGVPKGWSKVGGAGKVPVYRMDFTDATHGLAYYYNVGFKKTSDGGKTWKMMGKVPSSLMGVTDLAMGSSSVGYIVGDPKAGSLCGLYVTHDGGKTWTDSGSALGYGRLTRVCATDAKHAWAFGNGWLIYVTTDGGNTWLKQYGDPYGFGQIHGADFTDSNHGWATGTIDDLYLNDQVVFLRTVDGGQTWSSTSMAGEQLLTGLEFANSQRGWAAGGLPSSIYSTTDGGATWQVKPAPADRGRMLLGFASASKGWLVGYYLWQTTNGGTTWSKYLSTSAVNALDMAGRTSAFIHVLTPGHKYQLYRWKK